MIRSTIDHDPTTIPPVVCVDDDAMAEACRVALDIPRDIARQLGRSAVKACDDGYYDGPQGEKIDWRELVDQAIAEKVSIAPRDKLATNPRDIYRKTNVEIRNETTLMASKRLVEEGHRPITLNFANGIHPGGGFLNGARAQEEVLCRSSALYPTLVGDPMYEAHRARPTPDSTEWTIYSPNVPVFRTDSGSSLHTPWTLNFLTCAAPVARSVGQPESGDLLRRRIHRVLQIAAVNHYSTIVLGAWGCGAFGNDPHRTAQDFRQALLTKFRGTFSKVVFAITDWSPNRQYLGPFRDVFSTE